MRARTSVVLLALVLAAAACGGDPTVTATALPTVPPDLRGPTSPATPSPTASPTPTASPSPTPSPTPTGPRSPTDTDRARFAESYEPEGASDLEHVAVDLDGDDVDELVFTYVAGGRARIDVAAWDGREYQIVAAGRGGSAEQIDRLVVDDVNADGTVELALTGTGGDRRSLSLWAAPTPADLTPLAAAGGCADGSHTYPDGRLEPGAGAARDIRVTCADGTEQRYVWDGGAYRHREPDPTETATPSPTDTDGLDLLDPDDD